MGVGPVPNSFFVFFGAFGLFDNGFFSKPHLARPFVGTRTRQSCPCSVRYSVSTRPALSSDLISLEIVAADTPIYRAREVFHW